MTPAQRQIALRKMALPSIPEDWEMVTVGSIAHKKPNAIVGGPFGSDLVSTDYVPAGVPVIRGQNMGQSYLSGDFVFVSDKKAKALSSNLAAPGDVVFTQRGTLGQVSVVPDGPYDRYLISQSQMKLSVDPQRFNVGFLCQYFSSAAGQQQILESAIQTGVPHTNLAILRGYFLPRPPLPEQQAIAAALSDADGVVAGLERVIAKKRLIKQGAMQDLLTARCRLPGFSGEWTETSFGHCFQFLRTGSASRAQLGTNLGIGYIHYGDIHGMKSAVLDLSRINLPEIRPEQVATLSRVQDGDLVIADASEDIIDVGKSVEVQGVGSAEVVAGLHTFLLRGNPEVVVNGFKAYIQFLHDVRAGIESIATGSSVYGISKKNLAGLKFRVPPVKEQTAIGELFCDMDAEIQTLESRLAKARAVKEGIMQTLLTGRVRLV